MENKNSLNFFAQMAENNPNEKSVKITASSDFSDKDAAFLLNFVNKNSEILDLASGTGLIINKIFNYVKHITAIEAFPEFTGFIELSDKITIVNEDISLFLTPKKFDFITMFGVSQYFNEAEISNIYEKYFLMLKTDGKLIIKNQFGINEDVLISGYSEELKVDYYSEYRHIDKEVKILEKIGFTNVDVIDIYPPECNRWGNTHFYAIVADTSMQKLV